MRAQFLLLLVVAACNTDGGGGVVPPPPLPPPPPPPPPGEAHLTILRGAGQVGRAGEPLPEPVVVEFRDADGTPVESALLRFSLLDATGRLLNSTGITDARGRTAAVWLLGDAPLPQRLGVVAEDVEPVVVTARVGTPSCLPAECLDAELTEAEPFVPVTLHTYEGSGQAVHPDVLGRSGNRLPLAMVFTPYPFGNALREDPSLVESGNGRHWQVPAGVTNPLVRPATGHLSDPDIVRDPATGKERIYYREVAFNRNRIQVIESTDGITWSAPSVVLDVVSHRAVSPAVVAGSPWRMWTVNSGVAGCSATSTLVELRTSTDGLTWGNPAPVNLVIPGQVVWHLDVQWVPTRNEYWALANTYASGGTCVTRALFVATSADGVSWEVRPEPVMVAGTVPAFHDVVYRSTFRHSDDGSLVELLLSGAVLVPEGYRWSIGRAVVPAEEVLGGSLRLGSGVAVDWRVPAPPHLPPPEPFDAP